MTRRIIAWQLSLFGWPARPGYAWRRSFWHLFLGDMRFPWSEAAERQRKLLTPDSQEAA